MPFPILFGLQRRQPALDCFGRLRLWFMSLSVSVPHNVAFSRALQRVGCNAELNDHGCVFDASRPRGEVAVEVGCTEELPLL